MSGLRQPPRFVPTLTEVVPRAAAQPEAGASTGAHAGATAAPAPSPIDEEVLVRRVLQRVDVAIEARIREAVALWALDRAELLSAGLRDDIEASVREIVHEVLSDALRARTRRP